MFMKTIQIVLQKRCYKRTFCSGKKQLPLAGYQAIYSIRN
jgi:hypothetical protein